MMNEAEWYHINQRIQNLQTTQDDTIKLIGSVKECLLAKWVYLTQRLDRIEGRNREKPNTGTAWAVYMVDHDGGYNGYWDSLKMHVVSDLTAFCLYDESQAYQQKKDLEEQGWSRHWDISVVEIQLTEKP